MAKTPSGLEARVGTSVKIGDNRYGMRETYDALEDQKTKEYYRNGDTLRITESVNVKIPVSRLR